MRTATRIARDLHDLVIQRLYATGMSLEAMVPMVTRPEVASRIGNAVDAMDETIKDIRGTIFALQTRAHGRGTADLRAQVLDLVDEMIPALRFAPSLRLGAGLAAQAGGEVTEQGITALREALSNAARHSGATRVDVTVGVDHDGFLTVKVADDGTGIPPGGRRSGLRNLADRAAKLGGEAYPPSRRPLTMPGVTRMKCSCPSGSSRRRPMSRSRAMSWGSVTSCDRPTAITLQPCPLAST